MPKISNLTSTAASSNTDYVVTVANTAGAPVTRRITVANFFGNVDSISVDKIHTTNTSTPANSGPGFATGVASGQVWSDGSYLYVAVSANTIKRVAISTF